MPFFFSFCFHHHFSATSSTEAATTSRGLARGVHPRRNFRHVALNLRYAHELAVVIGLPQLDDPSIAARGQNGTRDVPLTRPRRVRVERLTR